MQHAYNPVDWHPWTDEAFEKARREDKPIFLSIGYSTCHWCHVMERESFEDPDVARLMNETFVSIKVDREERPDIDSAYMQVCQMMTGTGGWPLTIIMTPDKRPFFAATYLPKESRFGRVGMMELVPYIKELWETRREEIEGRAAQALAVLQAVVPGEAEGDKIGEETLKRTYYQLLRLFDERHGGFGVAPKFPTPHNLTFLLRYWKRYDEAKALEMVEKTLQAMRRGGIYDHVGFGFHRYSTDAAWVVPHFEKMLYDQALIAVAYIEAYQATGKKEYRETAREIFTYVLRDMTAPEGGFYSAEDADSDGEEGKFYVWTDDEIRRALGEEKAELVIKVFGIQKEGNFREEATRAKTGRNILYLQQPLSEAAAELRISEQELEGRLEEARQKLFEVRVRRVHPFKDDKILTDWNGLMIAALAKGAQVLNNPQYAEAAGRAAEFILSRMRDAAGRLLHRYREGEAAVPAFLDDYAFLTWGLIELYEATFAPHYLEEALALNNTLVEHFWDDQNGGLYFTAAGAADIPVRQKDAYDGAIPSGNSVAMLNLLRLGRMTANSELEEKAAQIGRAFSAGVIESPASYTQMMAALDFALGPAYEVVIAGDPQAADTQEMLTALRRRFIPNKVVLFRPTGEEIPEITQVAGFTRELSAREGKATAYVCRNYHCEIPTTDASEMLLLLSAPNGQVSAKRRVYV